MSANTQQTVHGLKSKVGPCTWLLAMFASLQSGAQVNSWTNAAASFWDVQNNWSLNVAPTNTHSVFITNAGTKTVTIDNFTSSVTNRMTVTNLTVSGVGPALNTLSLNNAGIAASNTLRVLNICTIGTNGALTINGSAIEVRGQGTGFGIAFTNDGTVTMNSGLFTSTNQPIAIVGNSGLGSFQLNGGTAHFGYCYVGNLNGSQGTFNQSGGTNLLEDGLKLGVSSGSSGTYNLTNGLLSQQGMDVSGSGTGIMNQWGGSNLVAGGVYFGSRGVYNLFNGFFSSNYEEDDGSESFNQSGGTHVTGQIILGFTGVGFGGYYNQTGGTNLMTYNLTLGLNSGGFGSYTLSDGFLGVSDSYVGYYVGQGAVNQNGGIHWVTNGLFVGYGPAANGSYTLSNGILNSLTTYVGARDSTLNFGSSTGTVYQVGGTNTVRGALYVGYDPLNRGTYTLDGGVLNASFAETGIFGVGAMSQSAGTCTVTNTLTIGDAAGSSGTQSLSGGTLTTRSTVIGHDGMGTMAQSGGTNLISNTFYLGDDPGGNGSYNLSSGVFGVPVGVVGGAGSGVATQTGGTATFTNNLTLALVPGSSGAYNLLGGLLTAGSVLINQGGTFTERGGTLNGTGTNYGAIGLLGGIWNGRLVHYGSLGVGPVNFDVSNGLANFSTITLTNGSTLTLDGMGLDNEGSFIMAGGTVAGNGVLMNNSGLSGNGSITGSGGFVNNALVTVSGGNLTLANTGANANNDEIDLAAGLQLRLTGAPLANNGGLVLNAGAVVGSAQLNNNSGGMLSGHGSITAPFFNNNGGMVLLDSGTLNLSQSFSNSGTITLTSMAANLAGGAINNRGTVQGLGSVGNNVANNGTIEAIGGTLTLGGSVVNGGNGLMSAPSGKLLVGSGLASQAGVISLSGGTFDNNGWPLNNTGQISGYGTFRSGGLANNGSVTFSGGTSTINGNVTNQATRRLTVAYNPAIFTGTVLNNGTFKVTRTTVEFTGTYIENGVFTSDPATNYFTDVIIRPGGYFLGGAGDLFSVSGDFSNGSLQNTAWATSQSELVFRGAPSHAFGLAGADAGTNYAGFTTNFSWGTVRLGAGEWLVLQNGSGSAGALYTKSLILEGGLSQVSNLTGNGMKIYYDPAASGNAYLGGGTYPLAAGGAIIPVSVPPVQIVSITFISGNARLDCTGLPNLAHQVQAGTNLANLGVIGSATASPGGIFSFTDTNAPAFPIRFYRLHVP